MDKILAVAKREFLATVRTKAFLLTVVMLPGLMLGAVLGFNTFQEMAHAEVRAARRLAVVDHSGAVAPEFAVQVEKRNARRPNQPLVVEVPPAEQGTHDTLIARVRAGELDGYVIFTADVLDPQGSGCELGRKENTLAEGEELEGMINAAVFAARCRAAQLDIERVEQLRTPVEVRLVDAQTGSNVAGDKLARAVTPFLFMLVLFMGTFGISQGLLTTVIEEKSSRVVELLLSAVSPTQLMAGKILGTVLVGFLLLTVWGVVGVASAQTYNLTDLVTGYRLFIAVLYFVPGFLLMAALLAGIGAACNELKEAQSMVAPLSVLTVLPMLFWIYIAEYPSAAFSVVLSHVPPITPFIMILRVCSDPHTPVLQIVTSLALLWVSVAVAIWAAGKVFRVGVLMYGKQPSLRELVRWVRHA